MQTVGSELEMPSLGIGTSPAPPDPLKLGDLRAVWGGGGTHAGLHDVHPPTGVAVTWSAVMGNFKVMESLQARFASRLNEIVLRLVPDGH